MPTDNSPLDQQVHDLVDEANALLLEMMLPEAKAGGKAQDMVIRLRACEQQARAAGREQSARHLREVARMIENEISKTKRED